MDILNEKGLYKAFVVLGLLTSSLLQAQGELVNQGEAKNAQTEAKDERGKPEKIQVTGSRIKRIEAESTAPIQVFDREVIESSGVGSLGDFFRKSATSSPLGNYSGPSIDVYAGFSTVDLLGLGASRTLVLLNGKRLPVVAGLEAVNIDNIPVSLVERVELLTGGASAVYGADAVGGVLNIITKKSVEGTEIAVYVSQPSKKGGEERELTVTQGLNFGETAQFMLTAGIRTRELIDIRNRDLARSTVAGFENTLISQVPGSWSYRPGTLADGEVTYGNWAPSTNCPAANRVATDPSEPDNIYCAGSWKDRFVELMPKKEEKFASILGDFEIGGGFRTNVMATFHTSNNPTDTDRFLIYSRDPFTDSPMILSRAKAIELKVIDDNVAGDYFQVYAPIAEEPKRLYNNINDAYTVLLGVEGALSESWRIQSSVAYSKMQSKIEGYNIFNNQTVSELILNPNDPFNADPQFNPLDPNRDTAAFLGSFTDLRAKSVNDTKSVDIFADTDLLSLAGGPLTLGIGVAASFDQFEQTPDSKDTEFTDEGYTIYTGTFAERGKGKRQTISAFAEANAPVLQNLEIDGALRLEKYSDFGDTANFGFGTKYTPLPWLAVRGRAATSYKAPPLTYLHKEGGGGYLEVTDQNWCDREKAEGRPCPDPTNDVFVDSAGNKELDPETGINYIGGLIIEPLPGISVTADYYWVNLKDTFEQDSLQEVVNEWYQANAGNKTGGNVNANTVAVDEDGIVTSVRIPFRNLGKIQLRALSSALNARTKVSDYHFAWSSQYFRTFSYREQDTASQPLRDKAGYYEYPAWRASHSLGLGWNSHQLTFSARTTAGQSQDPELADQFNIGSSIPAYNEYDFVYDTELPWNGALQLGVNNIRDTIGGLSRANALGSEDVVSTALYSYVGRTYFARLTQKF